VFCLNSHNNRGPWETFKFEPVSAEDRIMAAERLKASVTPVTNPVGEIKTVADSQEVESQVWRDNNRGAVIKDLGPCGDAKTFDPNKKYEGPSGDNYANYCYNFIKSTECADKTCSVPQVFGACRDECTGKMNSYNRMQQIGKGAERVTYPEYKAWRDKTPYPISNKTTWSEHCNWKNSQAKIPDNMVKC